MADSVCCSEYGLLTTKHNLKMEIKRMKCKLEPVMSDGSKPMLFTKGKIYEFNQREEDCWETIADDGNIEEFFNLKIMFEEVK